METCAEDDRDYSLKLLVDSWSKRENELKEEREIELNDLREQISKLKHSLDEARIRFSMIDEENRSLENEIQDLEMKNQKLIVFKANLLNTIRESNSETPNIMISPRTIQISPAPSSSTKIPATSIFPPSKVGASEAKYTDGKKFFSDARARLSYEVFTRFLSCVKMLNDKVVTKESALAEVREIFGDENSDLYREFSCLISKK